MKTEQEQIEEMAKQMCGAIDNPCIHDCTPACGAREYAKRCFKAGYRKQSDVVREFAEKLKEKFNGYEATYYNGNEESWHDLQQEIDELAAEFGAEVK